MSSLRVTQQQYEPRNIAYCSNVHPGESLEDVMNNIQDSFSAVKANRKLSHMASGLWLSAKAANTLITSAKDMSIFKDVLAESGMLLTSLNGFPYGNFHQAIVKKSVYLPNWAQQERLDYSQNLAKILAYCLPENVNFGAISTLPLAYKEAWSKSSHSKAIAQLISLSLFLKQLEDDTGKHICFGLEMEPDCIFETTEEFIDFFQKDLIPAAQESNISQQQLLRYIGCCYDTCHQAVLCEDIYQSLTDIEAAGIRICKIQISNAVSAKITNIEQVKTLNTLFSDPKFLHQTKVYAATEQASTQPIITLPDLSTTTLSNSLIATISMDSATNNQADTEVFPTHFDVRVHYHIPIHQHQFPVSFLSSTQNAILAALTYLQNNDSCRPLLEIETYTWLNLLVEEKNKAQALTDGLNNEFSWLENELKQRHLIHALSNTR